MSILKVRDKDGNFVDVPVISGRPASIKVGEVKLLEPNSEPTIENIGTEYDAIFDFGIPKGEYIVQGEDFKLDLSDYVKQKQLDIEIQNRQQTDNTLQSQIKSLASGSPLVATSIGEMTDTTKVYVNTTDGNWYYHNGTNWISGGVYQATEIDENSIDVGYLTKDIQNKTSNYNSVLPNYTMEENKFCKVTSSGYQIDTVDYTMSFRLYTVDVVAGEQYKIKTNLVADIYQIVFANNNNYISSYTKVTNTSDVETDIVVPNGANKMYVNSRRYRQARIAKLSLSDINKNIDKTKTLENVLLIENKEDITSSLVKTEGKFFNANTDNYDNWSQGSYYTGSCEVGDEFIVSARYSGNMSSYTVLDENGLVVQSSKAMGYVTLENERIVINNENAHTIIFNNMNDYTSFKVEKVTKEYKDVVDESEIEKLQNQITTYETENNFEVENLQRRCKNLEKNNKFAWDTFDKSYFAFVIDDCNSFTPTCADLFQTLEVPLGCAVIINTLNTIHSTAGGRTIKQVLQDVVSNGGEVLAHYSGNLADPGYSDGVHTFLTSDEDWNKRTREVKKTLEENGFNVRGLIRADSTKANTNKGEEICKKYFDYSDNMGKSKQYFLGARRFFIGVSSMDSMKTWIDNCCRTPGFYPLCLHGNRSDEPLVNVTDLTEIVNYIKSKGSNVAEITTYSNVFDEFGSTELEQRLKVLENK